MIDMDYVRTLNGWTQDAWDDAQAMGFEIEGGNVDNDIFWLQLGDFCIWPPRENSQNRHRAVHWFAIPATKVPMQSPNDAFLTLRAALTYSQLMGKL